jgi:hypothetical protein
MKLFDGSSMTLLQFVCKSLEGTAWPAVDQDPAAGSNLTSSKYLGT